VAAALLDSREICRALLTATTAYATYALAADERRGDLPARSTPEAAELALWLREIVLAADRDLYERVYRGWGAVGFRHPVAGYVCGLFPKAEGRVELLFEHGVELADPAGMLRSKGIRTRVMPIAERDDLFAQTITAYVHEAIGLRSSS
jgi:hypothetical protein